MDVLGEPLSVRFPLTLREKEVLRYCAYGFTKGQIAYRMGIGLGTVGNHLTHIRLKLSYRGTIAGLITLAKSLGEI